MLQEIEDDHGVCKYGLCTCMSEWSSKNIKVHLNAGRCRPLPSRPYAPQPYSDSVLSRIQIILQLSVSNFIFRGEFHANVEFLRQTVTLRGREILQRARIN